MSRPETEAFHQDPGLQPERTILSWDRTLLLLVTAAAFSLRWLDEHGAFVLVLCVAAILVAGVFSLGQRGRYRLASVGIAQESVAPAVGSALGLTLACVGLSIIGLVLVLFLNR